MCVYGAHNYMPALFRFKGGDSDGNITAWDIGIPSGSDYTTTVKPLFTLKTKTGAILNITLADNDRLVAGCEGGCYVWNVGPGVRGKVKYVSHFPFQTKDSAWFILR